MTRTLKIVLPFMFLLAFLGGIYILNPVFHHQKIDLSFAPSAPVAPSFNQKAYVESLQANIMSTSGNGIYIFSAKITATEGATSIEAINQDNGNCTYNFSGLTLFRTVDDGYSQDENGKCSKQNLASAVKTFIEDILKELPQWRSPGQISFAMEELKAAVVKMASLLP